MKRGLYAAGALVLLTLLLTPAFGADWVNLGGNNLNPAVNPQRVSAAPVANGNAVAIGPASEKGGSPNMGGPRFGLEYVYIDPPLYSIWSYPWYGYTSSMRFQALYTSDRIGRSGTIHEISVFKDYYGSSYHSTFPNVSVKLCNTTVSTLGSSASGNYGGGTPVTVFHATSLARGASDNWDSVTCQTDFTYDNSKNLLVEVTWEGSGSGYTYTMGTYVSYPYMAYYPGSGDTTYDYMYTAYYLINTRIGFNPPANNVGVKQILSPSDPFMAYGDTVYPICIVHNYGSAEQDNIPVRCKINEKVSGTQVYNQVQYINLMSDSEATVSFPPYTPPIVDMAYVDTMRTENPGDAHPENDMKAMEFAVTQFGAQCVGYENGSFDNAVSWINWGWWATKYPQPLGGACNGMNVWTTSFGGADYYPEHCQIFGDDGNGGTPGTMLFDTTVTMKTNIWTSMYMNHYAWIPVSVDYDSFFVSEYEQTYSSGGNYLYTGMCFVNVQVGRDYGNYQNQGWYKFNAYGDMNFGMDYCYGAPLIDGSCVGITTPPATIDSNTTFQPVVQIKNTGLKARPNIPFNFNIVIDSNAADTIYKGSGNTGHIDAGKTYGATMPDAVTPLPDNYTMTGYTMALYDFKYSNDTFAAPLFVRWLNVRTEVTSPRVNEVPGLVPVMVKLTNTGNVPAMVPRVDVTINPAGYGDYRENIAIAVGASQVVTLNSWVAPGGMSETAKAWITYPDDMNHGTLNDGMWNDTAENIVRTGIPGWTELTSLPATPSLKPIKDGAWMAYDGGTDAIYASKGNKTNDFYKFTLPGGTWATLQSIPLGSEAKLSYTGSSGCADGNGNLYMTKGNNTVGFWGYNAAQNKWTQLTDVPLGTSGKRVKAGAAMAWGTKDGVGSYAYLLKGYKNEFYRFDPVANSWTVLLNAPIGDAGHVKYDVGSWLVADPTPGSHVLYAFKGKYMELYKYDTDADTWSKALASMPLQGSAGTKKAKTGSCAAFYSGKIYALKGGNTTEFRRYFPLGDTWNNQFDIPLVGNSGQRKKVNGGGSMAGYPGTGVYCFKGNKTYEFWRYTPYDVTVASQPNRGGVMASSTPMENVTFAISPNPLLNGLATVRYNLPKAGLATLTVFDVTGRSVFEQTMAAGHNGTASLDLRKLDAGVYLVKVATEGFSTTQKLIVEH